MEIVAPDPRKVHLISLGCARNRVDSEVMLGGLLEKGWKIVQSPEESDAVVVNTCGFIGAAKEESIDTILTVAALKAEKPDLKLVVTGCLTQRYKRQLLTGLPEVDLFIGTDEFSRIGELIDRPSGVAEKIHAKRTHYIYSDAMPRTNTLSRYSAYVKVAEGCQHNCSFCIIPAIRGKLRSRPISSVVSEVTKLVEQGVMEINLIAQDLAAYGRDWDQKVRSGDLLQLLKELVKIENLKWIRLLYVYPENINDEFLEFFASNPKIVKYLDIPVQHANDEILKRMNRVVSKSDLINTIGRVRRAAPTVAIRTTVMVGFPGETEEQFNELVEFVRTQKFEHLGAFSYSAEEGTVAARMPDQISEEVKQERLDSLMAVQQEISRQRLRAYVGTAQPVLVLGPSEETELLWEGRLPGQAPEVDGVVYLNDGRVEAGKIVTVGITESHDYDLVGTVLDSGAMVLN